MTTPRRVLCLSCIIVALLTGALAGAAGATTPNRKMLERINAARQDRNLGGVRRSRSLNRSSTRYARWIIRSGLFRHPPQIHASKRFRRLGEVLAVGRGSRPDVGGVLRSWLASSSHRATLLSPRFDWIGVGRTHGRFHGRVQTIWVVQLGST